MNVVAPAAERAPHRLVLAYVFLVFFVISLLTNSLGALIPEVISGFQLSLVMAGLMPFAFFAAYGAMSIPAGMLVAAYGEKRVCVAAFALATVACATFAALPVYGAALSSLFAIGAGMAVLQVAGYPLLREAGGAKNYAFYSTVVQFVFGAASYVSPWLYAWLVNPAAGTAGWWRGLVPPALPWMSLYWVFAALAGAMVALTLALRLELTAGEPTAGLRESWRVFRQRTVMLYFIGIFAYVGSEQGTANWLSEFLRRYHGFDPRTIGAEAVANFWGFMTVGCLVALPLLKRLDSRRLLIGASALALALLSVALFGPGAWARWAFPCVGFAASVMWPLVFALGMNSIASGHSVVAGILCTAIIGGAVMPPVIGFLGDHFGLRAGMLVLYATFGWIFSVGFWARPIVSNVGGASAA